MAIAEVNPRSPASPGQGAGGQRLYYEVHPRSPASAGQGARGEGEPLLCVAGLACDTLVWIPQVQAFAAAHKTVIFDNRDVGQSSLATGDYEIADLARDALALADELGLDSFHLLGVSMGGAIAQEVAIQAPERVRTLTLAVTFPSGGAYARRLAEVWPARVRQISREQHIDELMLLNHSEAFYENDEMVQFIRTAILNNPHPQPPEAFARQLAACARHDAREQLGSLTMPTHVIGGEYDILVPVWKSREIAALIPGSKLTVLPGAPHGLSIERAEEFNAAVLGFIREAAAAPAA
jgi:pimeloyl-ACP methyl ester carboxylesterase